VVVLHPLLQLDYVRSPKVLMGVVLLEYLRLVAAW
jgi:hypothetical protein